MHEFCKIEREGHLTIVTLNRPDVMNALHHPAHLELEGVWDDFAADPEQWVAIVTGAGTRAFSAGNDLKYQAGGGARGFVASGFAGLTSRQGLDKPIIAAVSGFALGGGCELAMLCDFIIASETARFGQPEINLGVMPGIGGTQRLPRAVGKSKAMDMILTARMMDAAEAERAGLVSRVVPADKLIEEAVAAAVKIAGQSPLAVMMNKELVNAAFETTLATGVRMERRLFHSLFAFEDQKEGMAAFIDKRKPAFTGK